MKRPADATVRSSPPQTLTPPDGEDGTRCWVLRSDSDGIDRLLPRTSRSVLRMVQLAPGRLHTRLFRFVGRAVDVDGGSTDLPLRATGTTPPGRATVTVPLARHGIFTAAAHDLAPDDVLVWPPSTPYFGVSPAGYRWVTVILPATSTPRVEASTDAGTGLRAAPSSPAVRRAVDELVAAMDAWGAPGATRLDGDRAASLVTGWTQVAEWALAHAARLPEPSVGRRNATAVVAAAERVLVRRLGEVVYLRELVDELRVPARTLEAAFRSVLAMTPMRYLELLRAHAVFSSLRADDPGAARSVEEAEVRAGVRHGARFAARYRAVFGETPAQTLRAARERPRPS